MGFAYPVTYGRFISMTRLAVLFTGGIGAALVGRMAYVYRADDPLALGIVALIAAGLLAGLLELWFRAGRAASVGSEVASLPVPASPASISAASAPVRTWLSEARAGHAPRGGRPGLTPYLAALLVMVGMLGTFLGLVDTLSGARRMLTASPDVETLRAGLAGPFAGLTRAFGTSVAGVGASAALGLAALFVRRLEYTARETLVD